MAVAFPPPLVPIAGASDREGRSRRNRHHWIAPSRGIIPIFLILIIAAHRGFNIEPFSGSLQYGNATRLQTDDGSDRGHARWLFRRAKVSVGPCDRRRRASSARGLSSTSFGVLGLTRARQSILAKQQGRLRRRLQEWSRAFLRCAPHTPSSISHACARSRHTGVSLTAAREADGWREQQREVPAGCDRQDGDGAGGGSSEARRMLEGDDRRRMTRAGVKLNGARERVPISVSATTAGRALSLASIISASVTRRRPASSSSVEAPMSPSSSPPIPPSYA